MPKFVIERNVPGAGNLTEEQFYEISGRSCSAIREHAKLGGFPADSILAVRTMIDPTTAEA
jgi:hypothetical protein